jgi:hypothetical protein
LTLGQVDQRFNPETCRPFWPMAGRPPSNSQGDGGARCPARPLATFPGARLPPRSARRTASTQVAAVCRRVCGVTLSGSLARLTAVQNPFLTDANGLPLNSTKQLANNLRSF